MQRHNCGNRDVHRCCGEDGGEGMTVFIWEVEEDFTKRQYLNRVLEIKVQNSLRREKAF